MSYPKTIEEAVDHLKWASLSLPTRQELRIHEGNREAIQQAARWVFNVSSFAGDRNKGLLFMGPKGTGKSHLMRCLSQLLFPAGFQVKKCVDIVTEFNDTSVVKVAGETRPIGGHQVIDKYAAIPRICFDDLCEEPMGKWYSEQVNIMQAILAKRGDLMATRPLLTMFTTNHGPEKQEEMYGARVRDRLALMHTPFVILADPAQDAVGFRAAANVMSWRKEEAAPMVPQPDNPAIAQLIAQMADEKNVRIKEELDRRAAEKAIYLEEFIARVRKMDLTDLFRCAKYEKYVEAMEIARQEFDRRSPITLEKLEEEAAKGVAKKEANNLKSA